MAKLGEIVNNVFIKTASGLMVQPLPAKAAYKLKKIVDKVNSEIKDYETARMALISKYGNKNEAGELIKDENEIVSLSEENLKIFQKELGELLNVEVELSSISIEDLSEVKLTAEEIAIISCIISE